jgi:hypothetical protein
VTRDRDPSSVNRDPSDVVPCTFSRSPDHDLRADHDVAQAGFARRSTPAADAWAARPLGVPSSPSRPSRSRRCAGECTSRKHTLGRSHRRRQLRRGGPRRQSRRRPRPRFCGAVVSPVGRSPRPRSFAPLPRSGSCTRPARRDGQGRAEREGGLPLGVGRLRFEVPG